MEAIEAAARQIEAEEAAEEAEESAVTSPPPPEPLEFVIALKPLKLRSHVELDSIELGDLVAGQHVHVIQRTTMQNGDVRAHVADTALRPLGWITEVKDGHSHVSADPDHHHTHLHENLADDHLPEWVSAVKHCVLFDHHHGSSELHFIHAASRVIQCKAGECLYAQGDAPSMMYLVHSGLFRASVPSLGRQGKAGELNWARDYGPGDNFGACELLSHMGCRQCTVEVVADGMLWGIPHHVIDSHLKIPPPNTISGLQAFVEQV